MRTASLGHVDELSPRCLNDLHRVVEQTISPFNDFGTAPPLTDTNKRRYSRRPVSAVARVSTWRDDTDPVVLQDARNGQNRKKSTVDMVKELGDNNVPSIKRGLPNSQRPSSAQVPRKMKSVSVVSANGSAGKCSEHVPSEGDAVTSTIRSTLAENIGVGTRHYYYRVPDTWKALCRKDTKKKCATAEHANQSPEEDDEMMQAASSSILPGQPQTGSITSTERRFLGSVLPQRLKEQHKRRLVQLLAVSDEPARNKKPITEQKRSGSKKGVEEVSGENYASVKLRKTLTRNVNPIPPRVPVTNSEAEFILGYANCKLRDRIMATGPAIDNHWVRKCKRKS